MGLLRRLGQASLATVFVSGGIDVLRDPEARALKAAPVADAIGMDATKLVRANAAAMVVGGLALVTDHAPRLAALGLAGSLVPTTAFGHRFWEETDPLQKSSQRAHFAKNVSLAGACLLVAITPRRRTRAQRKVEHSEE